MEIIKAQSHELTTPRQYDELIAAAWSSNTHRAYANDWKQFVEFCDQATLIPLPAESDTIREYIDHLAKQYKLSTIHRKLSAISTAHESEGIDSPTKNLKIKKALKGLKNIRSGEEKDQAPPLTVKQIETAARDLAERNTNKALRDRAVILLGFFGAFRRSELAALRWEDIQDDEKGLTILIRKSKTDQEGKGQYKVFPYRSNPKACPVRALTAWQMCDQVTGRDFVFTSITKGDNVKDKPLSGKDIDRLVKGIWKDQGYSAHSFRSGFVTEARRKKARIEEIKAQTGHKSDVQVLSYFRSLDAWEDNAALLL